MDEIRGMERIGARMKKVREMKRMRERRIYAGFRRARLNLCTACLKGKQKVRPLSVSLRLWMRAALWGIGG